MQPKMKILSQNFLEKPSKYLVTGFKENPRKNLSKYAKIYTSIFCILVKRKTIDPNLMKAIHTTHL